VTARPGPAMERQFTPVPLPPEDCPILGVSPAIRRAIGLALRFAPTELPILLVGPTGSGKELFARCIHQWSGRRGAHVDVNAGALPREMVESLLFGHRKGAFTGAMESSDGLLVAADGGTLFLDELTSLPPEGQAKLLRVLETGEVRALGAAANRAVRCRFVAAVQEDVDGRVRRGEFRLDLYQRVAGVVIRLPALAERPEDIVPLARVFARTHARELTPEAEVVLGGYGWPGNVRELRAAVIRASFLTQGQGVDAGAMLEAIELSAPREEVRVSGPTPGVDSEELIALCRRHRWDVGSAARAIGIGRSTLYRRLRETGIDPMRWRGNGGG
jgi:DNA-binding NtrC family response regulator